MSLRNRESAAAITIVDDDLATCHIVREILSEEGYRLTVWDGVEDPCLTIARSQPNLVIQDVRLGNERTIWTLLDYIDDMPPVETPAAIVFTADQKFVQVHRQTLENRCYSVIEKHFDLDHLLSSITDCLKESRDDTDQE